MQTLHSKHCSFPNIAGSRLSDTTDYFLNLQLCSSTTSVNSFLQVLQQGDIAECAEAYAKDATDKVQEKAKQNAK